MGRPYKCRSCGSTDTTWKGYRKLKAGKVRLRRCKQCGRKFTTNEHIQDEEKAVSAVPEITAAPPVEAPVEGGEHQWPTY